MPRDQRTLNSIPYWYYLLKEDWVASENDIFFPVSASIQKTGVGFTSAQACHVIATVPRASNVSTG